ncbi:MAG TPA: hypothetical protein VGR18_04455 [Rubrobacter sp.]|nr:hypothetical protein [Rubrobacter sp.]
MRRILLLLLTVAVLTALAGVALAAPGNIDSDVNKGLAQVRQATAKYHEASNALADGYLPTEHCVAVPGVGGMGYHYVNPTLIGDPSVDPLKPEVLLYAPKKNGEPKLVGVEYLVVDADQDLSTEGDRPNLFGVLPFNGPMEGHEPGMPIHYDLHAWIFKGNPDGVFADFNPKVRC